MTNKKAECAGGIVLNKNREILVVNQNYDSWSLPKGHIDPGESSLDAAKREIYEESGIKKLKYIRDLGSYERFKIGLDGTDDKTELKKIYLYLFTTEEMKLQPIDPMNPEARWGSLSEVCDLLTHRADRKYLLSVSHLWTHI